MNIRDAIAAGELDRSVEIVTTVGETEDYGRACNHAGYANGFTKGLAKGAVIGIAGIATGILVGMIVDITLDTFKKKKED